MISSIPAPPVAPPDDVFVWCWLPEKPQPVVAGRLYRDGDGFSFNYGQSWLKRPDAIPLYLPELPLQAGRIPAPAGLEMAGCLRDAAPDAWGRRVILNQLASRGSNPDINELLLLLYSGSDRIGALDFQADARRYQPRIEDSATLEELQHAADMVERGEPISPALERALFHGSSIGGARPKALINATGSRMIAKFSSSTDLYSVVKAEFIAMRLAAKAGLNVAEVALTQAAGRDVLLIKRFDRVESAAGWHRRAMVSALTILGLHEMHARYAHYADLAENIRRRFTAPEATLREMFSRIAFNILVGNTDDHARNHAAFWDGRWLTLTPAYDLCPQARTGGEATQAMLISGTDRRARLATCLDAAAAFLLDRAEAQRIINRLIAVVQQEWEGVCAEAGLSAVDRHALWRRQFLNPYALQDWPESSTARRRN